MRRAVYTYRVVTCNGAGVHGPDWTKCSEAKAYAQRLADSEQARVERCVALGIEPVRLGPYEIERREWVTSTSWRNWMRRRSRWVLWGSHEDVTVRQPDWIYGGAE